MNYSLQRIVVSRGSGAGIATATTTTRSWSFVSSLSSQRTTTRRRQQQQQSHNCLPSHCSSSTALPSRCSRRNQQELFNDTSSYYRNFNAVSLESAPRLVTTAFWHHPIPQPQQQRYQQREIYGRRWQSTMRLEEKEEKADGIMDYFAIFGMPRRYNLDMKELKQRYLRLMTEYHPDKQHQLQLQIEDPSSSSSSSSSPSISAHDITNAYQILTESHTRANHLLELIGQGIVEENDKNHKSHAVGGSESSSSSALVGMDFLLQVMEWRERIETLTKCRTDTSNDKQCSFGSTDKDGELHHIWVETQGLQQNCEDELAELWNQNDGIMTNHETLQQARTLTAQLQYWHRLRTALREEMEM
jgi:hypothetical protein